MFSGELLTLFQIGFLLKDEMSGWCCGYNDIAAKFGYHKRLSFSPPGYHGRDVGKVSLTSRSWFFPELLN